jgi:hypothetical protein
VSKGALLNYTTEIAVEKTIGEIYAILAQNKVMGIMSEYDGSGNILAIAFKSKTEFGEMVFRLPANVQAAAKALNSQVDRRVIPRRYYNDVDQARRVSWRIVRQWIEAQMALIQLGQVKLEQVFLPYAQNCNGQTLYEALVESRFEGLTLPAPAVAA